MECEPLLRGAPVDGVEASEEVVESRRTEVERDATLVGGHAELQGTSYAKPLSVAFQGDETDLAE